MRSSAVRLLKTCVQTVGALRMSLRTNAGLSAGTRSLFSIRVAKWVGLYCFNPRGYTLLFPTHFCNFTSVYFGVSTLSTAPIISKERSK